MALVNQVSKTVRMDLWSIVRYQISTYCYLKQIKLSEPDLDCLTYLAVIGESELPEFCENAAENNIFKTSQSVRNSLTKSERKKLIVKKGKNKKKIKVNPDMKVQAEGNILLLHKMIYVDEENSRHNQ